VGVQQCEVLVIGGGPAGSTAAALLAEQGRKVVLLEKEVHPRFHIGESLLPANMPLLDRLGVRDEVAAIGMPKLGVEFISPYHDHATALRFTDAWDKSLAGAFQVRRSVFDHLLLRNAARKGASVHEGQRVRQVDFRPGFGGVQAQSIGADGAAQDWEARLLIDASGRDTFIGNKFRIKEKNPRHASAAVFGHFRGAERHAGSREGDITIFWFEHGWFWFIPLADGTTSVGAVCWPYYLKSRNKPVPAFFADTIALCPPLARRLEGATPVDDVHATGNYSYSCTAAHGAASEASCLMAGDAFAFIDPVFSSGVFLAMSSAFMAVEAAEACLEQPIASAAAMRDYERRIRKGPREFSWFIERMTHPVMRELFMYPRNRLRAREAVMSILAGDLYRGTPYKPSLLAFKSFYYMNLLKNPLAAVRNWRERKYNIRDSPLAADA
jgi:flavin-dependent dehydrogenase